MTDKPQLVLFSVPYNEGWTAEVNGRTAEVEKVDGGLMAVKTESGRNTIVFRYETPGLKYGIIISASALLAFVLYLLICRCFRGKEKEFGTSHTYDYVSQGDSAAVLDFYDIVMGDTVKVEDEKEAKDKDKEKEKTEKK